MPSTSFNPLSQSVAIDLALEMKIANESKKSNSLAAQTTTTAPSKSFSLRSSILSLVPSSSRSSSSLATSGLPSSAADATTQGAASLSTLSSSKSQNSKQSIKSDALDLASTTAMLIGNRHL
ncbi:hypothetical protein HK100_002305 [Physocladia obscura]|uniref:Uncharacterized protein n=1 Tax=Physocladia obscura TaxID=109957 RepID=A0AAD5SVZ4_9FUNG|nr:hypothetical protein HK100_002305 [Physocladia obscura]